MVATNILSLKGLIEANLGLSVGLFFRLVCSRSDLYNSGMFVNTRTWAAYFGILNNLLGIKTHLLPPPWRRKANGGQPIMLD